jgi:hypothetical protein
MHTLLPPRFEGEERSHYVASPRAKRAFRTVLDAQLLFREPGQTVVEHRLTGAGSERRLEIVSRHQLARGTLTESSVLEADCVLRPLTFERQVTMADGTTARHERIDFTKGLLPFPEGTYPEVLIPFLLRFQPFDGTRRSTHAWVTDRFVARVYYESSRKPHRCLVPVGTVETWEVVMYPDLSDWVKIGAILTDLVKPLIPKYHMWFEVAAPHRLVRFEGPYGPPGAPELVLELSRVER